MTRGGPRRRALFVPAQQRSDDMKHRILIAAGLLCLGGPAFAFAIPAMAPDMAKAVKDVWADQMAAQKPSMLDTGAAWMGDAKLGKPEAPALVAAAKPVDPTLAGELGGATVAVGGGAAGEPVGLRQTFLAVLAVGDRDAEEGLLGVDPILALGALGVDADPGILDEIAGADRARRLQEGLDQVPLHLALGERR